MNLALFSTLFIVQFVGHRIGDYLLQSDRDAMAKASSFKNRLRHCLIYSVTITLLLMSVLQPCLAILVGFLTIIEHIFIDSRVPVIWWKRFFETKIMRNKDYDVETLPFFILVEIDQTIHYVRIFIISFVLAHVL